MTSQNRPSIAEQTTSLLWGLWTELGVPGWVRTHENWLVDPEPLIVFTDRHRSLDQRLFGETKHWRDANQRFVSKARLKRVEGQLSDVSEEGLAHAPTSSFVGTAANRQGEGGRITTRRMAPLRAFTDASQIVLRMRATFGVGARCEILRFLLLGEQTWWTVGHLANVTAYTKRNIAEECDALTSGGQLRSRRDRNVLLYELVHPTRIAAIVEPLPDIRPQYVPLFRIVSKLLSFEAKREHFTDAVRLVEGHRVARAIANDAESLGIPLENLGQVPDRALIDWGAKLFETVSTPSRWRTRLRR